MMKIAGKDVGINDLGILGGGVVVLIASFFKWFGISIGGTTYGDNAWGTGVLSWFSVLLGILAAGAVAARVFGGAALPTTDKAGPNAIILGVASLGVILVVLKLLIGYHSTDRKIGIFLGLIGLAVEAYFAFMAFTASGEKRPDFKNFGGGSTPPPAVPPTAPETPTS
jgi:hypothetical protein